MKVSEIKDLGPEEMQKKADDLRLVRQFLRRRLHPLLPYLEQGSQHHRARAFQNRKAL